MPKEDLFEIRAQKLEAFEDSGGVAFPRGFDVLRQQISGWLAESRRKGNTGKRRFLT